MTDTGLDSGDRDVLAAAGISARPDSVRALAGGFANRMLRVDTAAGTVVLRQWTRDWEAAPVEVAALREARADGLPVPEVLAAQDNRAVLSYVDGQPASAVLPGCTRAEAERIGEHVGELYRHVWDRPRHPAGLAVAGTGGLEFAAWDREPGAMFEDFLDRAWLAPAGWAAFAAGYADAMDYYTARPVRAHGDANAKNVLVRRRGDRHEIVALVDWEFTWAAPAEADLGNLLRFERVAVLGPFGRGVVRGTGCDAGQVRIARRLDLLAMAEIFSRSDLHRRAPSMLAALRGVAEAQLAAGAL